ncbi:MAG: PASTA domain-containing protein, partial [Phycisphaerales bacterium]
MKKTVSPVLVVAFAAGLFGISGRTPAEPVTINYQGIIDSVYDPNGLLDGSVVSEDAFFGSYTFESTAPSLGGSVWGWYVYDEEAPVGMTMTVTMGNYTFQTENLDPQQPTSRIEVFDNYGSGPWDNYEVGTYEISQTAGPPLQLTQDSSTEMKFFLSTSNSLSAIMGVDLPLTMPNLGNFETNWFMLQLTVSGESIWVEAALAPIVPDVVGMSRSAAESEITDAGFALGATSGAHSDTAPAGQVISQDPVAGTVQLPFVLAGSLVDVTMSIGPSDDPPVRRLVAHWKLDEAEGNVAIDSAGDSDGEFHGNPTWQPAGGKIAGALEFDGTDYVDCGNADVL